MCGRFTLSKTVEALAQAFGVPQVIEIEPQYNIAPTQSVTAVLYNQKSKEREFKQLHWGLIPSWAKEPSISAKLINARAETVAEKPAFRSAFVHRRCLILADGFYEWKKESRKKQPFYFCLKDQQPFAFAGLWEQWESFEGEQIASCTILTTQANDLVKEIHERMPVILEQHNYNLWLDQQVQAPQTLQPLLHSYPVSLMIGYPVSTMVNNPKYNNPECIAQIS
jgi:putative SOS response-associated peptidase YedK